MGIKYKIDILAALKEKGYTSYALRNQKLFGEATITKIRQGEIVNEANLSKLCKLLECQPGDILEYITE